MIKQSPGWSLRQLETPSERCDHIGNRDGKDVVIIEIRLNQYLFEIYLKDDQQVSESFVLAGFLFRTAEEWASGQVICLP